MKIWTVLIADNHPVSRAGLKLVLETSTDFEVIGEASSGQQTITVCQQLQPQIVLMDVNMPNGNGIEATEVLHRQFPQMIIIGISGFSHEEMQQQMMRAGAVGYISKETDFVEMIELIRILANRATPSLIPAEDPFHLTHSEHKILNLLAEGYDRQQIADYLCISLNTVKMHFRNLYQKLGVANANDAIKVALEHQLLS